MKSLQTAGLAVAMFAIAFDISLLKPARAWSDPGELSNHQLMDFARDLSAACIEKKLSADMEGGDPPTYCRSLFVLVREIMKRRGYGKEWEWNTAPGSIPWSEPKLPPP